MLERRILIAAVVGFVATARAGTVLYVDHGNCPGPGSGSELDPYCSIQTAINNAVDTDEIIVAPGTYPEAIDFLGKAIAVRSSDGPEATIIDAHDPQGATAVSCTSGEGEDTVLEGFAIGNGSALEGGGMSCVSSSPTVVNCIFALNIAVAGAGMHNRDSSPTVTGCSFIRNSAIERGAGMHNDNSSPIVTNCIFSGNNFLPYESGASDDLGGGMSNVNSSPDVTGCTFSGNSADYGGGMTNLSGSLTMDRCTFTGNSAAVGGGMYNSSAAPMMTGCTFDGNIAEAGGGLFQLGGFPTPTLIGCVFRDNAPTGVHSVLGDFLLANSLFHGQSDHGALLGGSVIVSNCTFADNGTSAIAEDGLVAVVASSVVRGGISIDGSSVLTVSYSNIEGGWPGIGNIDAGPLFVDPGSGDYRLQPTSPCIDAGDNAAVPKGIDTDLDGNPRFVDDPNTPDTGNSPDGGPVVDMGAYEFQSCLGDINNDGVVNVVDLLMLLFSFGPCEDCPADLDGSGVVDVLDLLTLIGNFGPCAGIECLDHSSCDDDNGCTIDLCIGGTCYHIPIGGPFCDE